LNVKENLENVFSFTESSTEKMWEVFFVSLGSMSWTQDQIQNLASKYLDQSKVNREEGIKLVEELAGQAKKNQQQMQEMIQEAVIGAFGNLDIPTFSYIDDLSKKVDELSKKVNNL